jgi:hypothetical protein
VATARGRLTDGGLGPRPSLARVAWAIAALPVLLQLATAGRYGIFRDEYYYLMCADHPAWGYVDHPPLAMVVLMAWKALAGDSVLALRVIPALLNGIAALGGALLAREMRGGAAAQAFAAALVGFLPGLIALGGFYSMNPFDVVFWVAAAWIVCRVIDPAAGCRWWWALGAVIGLGVLNKYSMVFCTIGLGVGLLLSPRRRELVSRPALTGAIIAFALVLPHLIWQIASGGPTFEFIRNAHELKNVAMAPGVFWAEQLLMAHPAFAPVWVAGLLGLLLAPRLRPWRPLGVAFVVVGLWLTLQHAKPYYLVPAYPTVLAAGAVLIGHGLARWRRIARAAAVALPVLVVLLGVAVAPMAIPILDPAGYLRYEQTLGLRPRDTETNVMGDLPQHFADRFGWHELAETVGRVHAALPEADRSRCLIVAGNYGECGAINYWSRKLDLGLPAAVSGHNSCFTWWPEQGDWTVILIVGGSRERLEGMFADVTLGAVSEHPLAVPFEQRIPVWVCREPLRPLPELRAEARFAV